MRPVRVTPPHLRVAAGAPAPASPPAPTVNAQPFLRALQDVLAVGARASELRLRAGPLHRRIVVGERARELDELLAEVEGAAAAVAELLDTEARDLVTDPESRRLLARLLQARRFRR